MQIATRANDDISGIRYDLDKYGYTVTEGNAGDEMMIEKIYDSVVDDLVECMDLTDRMVEDVRQIPRERLMGQLPPLPDGGGTVMVTYAPEIVRDMRMYKRMHRMEGPMRPPQQPQQPPYESMYAVTDASAAADGGLIIYAGSHVSPCVGDSVTEGSAYKFMLQPYVEPLQVRLQAGNYIIWDKRLLRGWRQPYRTATRRPMSWYMYDAWRLNVIMIHMPHVAAFEQA